MSAVRSDDLAQCPGPRRAPACVCWAGGRLMNLYLLLALLLALPVCLVVIGVLDLVATIRRIQK